MQPFRIHLRGTGTFRPVSPVVFVTLAEGISAVRAARRRRTPGPLAVDLAFPYHPHVTIAHHLDDPTLDRAFEELADFECVFAVDAFQPLRPRRASGLAAHRDFSSRLSER